MQVIEPYIWVIWDLLAVIIFFSCVYRCAGRGFVSTIAGLLVYVVAAAAAAATYAYIAGFLYDNFVYELVQHVLTRNFNMMLADGGKNAQSVVHAIPLLLRLLVGQKSGDVAALPASEADMLADTVIEIALKDPLMTLLYAAGFLLVFSLAAFFMRFLTRFLTGINRIPVIGLLNTVLGGIAGVIEGILSLYISGFVLRLIVVISGGAWTWLSADIIDKTYIWRLFY